MTPLFICSGCEELCCLRCLAPKEYKDGDDPEVKTAVDWCNVCRENGIDPHHRAPIAPRLHVCAYGGCTFLDLELLANSSAK